MNNETFLAMQQGANSVFAQLKQLLEKLSDEEYTRPSKVLFNATIGQHIRHIAELFIELEKGYDSGTVDYEKRSRDYRIETDKQVALLLLQNICINLEKPGKNLLLEGSYNESDNATVVIPTNYFRELAYNLEHAVHHMALIRIGVTDVSKTRVPAGFGVASATLKYRKACAQ